ncbi:hypothetical protein [Halostella sp. PRR32]|uniref:hypothetical protein n=1 Tax=Halostella sp. PRR32 TaxID=3098147 RepID=UPI002B1D8C2F|nr:hypothetical protein [Halostella sp. PRR32]
MTDDNRDDGRSVLDVPETIIGELWGLFRDHFLVFLVIIVGYLVLAWVGWLPAVDPSVPSWILFPAIFSALAVLGGYFAGRDIFPEAEPEWCWVVEFNNDDPATPRISKVTNPVVQDMFVVGGKSLHSPQGRSNLYVCRFFNGSAENPVAHVTWKDIPSDADLLGTKPSAIEAELASLRDSYESTHGLYKWVTDHLYMVIRRLDFRKSKSQNAVLEGSLSHAPGEDDSIDDVIDDVLPERIKRQVGHGADDPDRVDRVEKDADDGRGVDDDQEGDDGEALEHAQENPSNLPVATDGGR